MRKSGGGAHNWGSTMDQIESEMYDDGEETNLADLQKSASTSPADPSVLVDQPKDRRASVSTASTGMADDDKEKAIEYRSKALKDGNRECRPGLRCDAQFKSGLTVPIFQLTLQLSHAPLGPSPPLLPSRRPARSSLKLANVWHAQGKPNYAYRRYRALAPDFTPHFSGPTSSRLSQLTGHHCRITVLLNLVKIVFLCLVHPSCIIASLLFTTH